MEFRILGPFEASERGQPLDVGAGKQRALLALLLLRAGEVVSTDRLIDALWEERPPASALNSVHIYVSQLRKALGNGRLETRGHGTCSRSSPSSSTSPSSSACSTGDKSSSPRARPSGQRRPSGGTRPLAWTSAFGLHVRTLRTRRDRTARGAAPRCPGGEDRGRPRPRPPRRARIGARGARSRASAAGASTRSAHARPLPLGPPSGGARCVSASAQDARRGARARAGRRLQELEGAILRQDTELDPPGRSCHPARPNSPAKRPPDRNRRCSPSVRGDGRRRHRARRRRQPGTQLSFSQLGGSDRREVESARGRDPGRQRPLERRSGRRVGVGSECAGPHRLAHRPRDGGSRPTHRRRG